MLPVHTNTANQQSETFTQHLYQNCVISHFNNSVFNTQKHLST